MNNIGIDLPVTSGSDPAVVVALNSIITLLTGAKRPINSVESLANGNTPDNVQSMSIYFDGGGGTLDGVAVSDGFVASFQPNKGDDRVAAMPYTVPTTGAQRVIINYVDL